MENSIFEKCLTLKSGRTLSYSDFGSHDKPTLLVFHGTPGSRITDINEKVSNDSVFRIIAPERPGYGFSSFDEDANFISWTKDIKALLEHLKVDEYSILAGSGGAPYALMCSTLLEGLVSTTIVSSATPLQGKDALKGIWIGNKLLFWSAKNSVVLLRFLIFLYRLLLKLPILRKLPLQEAFRQKGKGMIKDLQLFVNSWEIPLHKIHTPVYMWHGEEDNLSNLEAAKALAKEIPNCTTHFIPNIGHFILSDLDLNQQIEDEIMSHYLK